MRSAFFVFSMLFLNLLSTNMSVPRGRHSSNCCGLLARAQRIAC